LGFAWLTVGAPLLAKEYKKFPPFLPADSAASCFTAFGSHYKQETLKTPKKRQNFQGIHRLFPHKKTAFPRIWEKADFACFSLYSM